MKSIRPQSVRSRKNKQRGVSIMSVLLGLVISAGVVAVIYDQFSDSQRKARVEAATAEISTMVASSQKLYGNANQYTNVTTAVAIQGGVVPDRLRVAGTTTAQNKYNGAITFAPATITTAGDSLTITYGKVPRADCQDIALSIDRLSRRIVIGALTPKASDAPMNLATLATACDAADVSDHSITFGRQ